MHGLTGGSWKRSADWATDAEKNNPGGKPRGTNGSTTYRRSTPPRQLPTLHQESASRRSERSGLLVRPAASHQGLRVRPLGADSRQEALDPPLAHGPELQRCLASPSVNGESW